jgi:hypothetical protein
MRVAAQAAGYFSIVIASEQTNFTRRPATGRCAKANTPMFAHGDDFLDGASGAAGEDGVGHFAELFEFLERPRSAPAAFGSF